MSGVNDDFSTSTVRYLSRVLKKELGTFTAYQREIIWTLWYIDLELQVEQLRDHIFDIVPPAALFAFDLHNYVGFPPEVRDFLAQNEYVRCLKLHDA